VVLWPIKPSVNPRSVLFLKPVCQVWGAATARADLRPIVQPTEKTKAAFLARARARARALRDRAVREGDQAYDAVVVCHGSIVREGRNDVVLPHDPTAQPQLLAVRDSRRLKKRELSGYDLTRRPCPAPMCQGPLYWARIPRHHNESTPDGGHCSQASMLSTRKERSKAYREEAQWLRIGRDFVKRA